MSPELIFVAGVSAYLLGSVSFARLIGRRVLPTEDLSRTTFELPRSKKTFELTSVSATSISMRTGPKYGCLTSLLDMAKAFIPVFLWRIYFPSDSYHLVAAICCLGGHIYPVYYRFRGGRGQSTLIGSLLVIDWLCLPVTMTLGSVIGLVIVRDPLVGYTAWVPLLIPWFWWRFGDLHYTGFALMVALLSLLAFLPEYKQYFWLRLRGDYQSKDLIPMLESTDMGRPIKYLRRWRLLKNSPEKKEEYDS
jgi:glycerol-3-phosphate acyltransferase PlsY